MIYPTFGLSIFAHMFIITAVKVKNFLGFGVNKKNKFNKKHGTLNKIFISFIMAVIIEFIFSIAVLGSVALIDVGITSDKSNLNIIKKTLYNYENKKNTSSCVTDQICYIKK